MSIELLLDHAGSAGESEAPFGQKTTYRVGGRARGLVTIESIDALQVLGEWLRDISPIYVLGNGSNTLVADEGFDGLVIVLGDGFGSIEFHDNAKVTLGAAVDLPVAARRLVDRNYRDFEWAVGVPGTVGGAIAMNAGGHGSDMAASVVSVRLWDIDAATVRDVPARDLHFGYRSSAITSRHVVLDATLQLREGDADEGRDILREIVRWRRDHQPGGANAGSVFQNPPGATAGALIDDCGCKGMRVGSAYVSEKHANFIQVDAGGRSEDVRSVMRRVHDTVLAERGIDLHSEIRLVGFS